MDESIALAMTVGQGYASTSPTCTAPNLAGGARFNVCRWRRPGGGQRNAEMRWLRLIIAIRGGQMALVLKGTRTAKKGGKMRKRFARWLYEKLFSGGRAYQGPRWYFLADLLKAIKT